MKSKRTIDLKQYNYRWITMLRKLPRRAPNAFCAAEGEGEQGRKEPLKGANAAALAQINHSAFMQQSWPHWGSKAKSWDSSFRGSFLCHELHRGKNLRMRRLTTSQGGDLSTSELLFDAVDVEHPWAKRHVAKGWRSPATLPRSGSDEHKRVTKTKEWKSFVWETTVCIIDGWAARRPQRTERIMGLSSPCQERTWRGLKRGSVSAPCPPCNPDAWSRGAQRGKQCQLSRDVRLPQPTPKHWTPPHIQHTLHHLSSWAGQASQQPQHFSRFQILSRVSSKSEYICRN